MEFLKSKIESEERINLALSGFELKQKIIKQDVSLEEKISTASSLLSTSPMIVKSFVLRKHKSFNTKKKLLINRKF